MARASVEERIAAWFLERLNVEISSSTVDLVETGLLDSLGFVELLAYLEVQFGITIAPEDIEVDNFRSIERISAFVLDAVPTAPLVPSAQPARLVRAY